MSARVPEPMAEQRFRVASIFALLIGGIGGLVFAPMALAWPLSIVQGTATGDLGALPQVTVVGWGGLALVLRFVLRPRLVLRDGVLRENRLFLSRRMPLSAVRSMDRVEGRVDTGRGARVDTIYLFREHPHAPWVVDLVMVDAPTQFMAALKRQCRVPCGNYSPKNAPPWAR